MMDSLLSLIIFLPLVVAALLLLVPADKGAIFRWTALAVTVVQLALGLGFSALLTAAGVR